MSALKATFQGHGRKAKCPPNPNFPNGTPVDMSAGGHGCEIALPYPAPECGVWIIECPVCQVRVGVTAAGRVDDVTTVKVGCKLLGKAQ